MSPSRILVVKLTSVGDVLHALPAVSGIRRRFPDAHLAWLVDYRAADVLALAPSADDLVVLGARKAGVSRFTELGPATEQRRLICSRSLVAGTARATAKTTSSVGCKPRPQRMAGASTGGASRCIRCSSACSGTASGG